MRFAVPGSQPARRELCHSLARASNVLLVVANSAALRACLLMMGFLPLARSARSSTAFWRAKEPLTSG
ncbi:hypothetical protein D3C78_1476540 [compost metagenome]